MHEAVRNYKKNHDTLEDVRRSYQLTPSNNTIVHESLNTKTSSNSLTLNNFKKKVLESGRSDRLMASKVKDFQDETLFSKYQTL